MSAKLLRGKEEAAKLHAEIKARTASVVKNRGSAPRLAVLSIGADPSARIYLKQKLSTGKSLGVECGVEALPEGASEAEALKLIDRLAKDDKTDGILIELPVPAPLNARHLVDAVPQKKDVEGLSAENLGRFYWEKSISKIENAGVVVPCTAAAVMRLIRLSGASPQGSTAVVVGRSGIVGRPVAHLLTCLDATVTTAHSRTQGLNRLLRGADIVVSAVGKPGCIKGAWLKPGALVIDVGMNPVGKKIVGDVEFEAAEKRAGWLTPVPGGVGPLAVACLFENVVRAAEKKS